MYGGEHLKNCIAVFYYSMISFISIENNNIQQKGKKKETDRKKGMTFLFKMQSLNTKIQNAKVFKYC